MLGPMAASTTLLRRTDLGDDGDADAARLIDRARDLAAALAGAETHTPLLFPDVCLYRFTEPTMFRKTASFGVSLGVVLQGAKRVRIDGHDITIDPRRLLVVTRESGYESAVVSATRQRPYLGLNVCFGPERVARALLAVVEAGGPAAPEAVPAFVMDGDAGLAGALERLLLALRDPLDRKLLAPLVIDEILYRLLRSPAAAAVRAGVGPAGDARRILDAMRFMREHYVEKLTVERLARSSGMSPSHFAHRFRAVARVSPKRYLREVRLDAARALLLGRKARVSEAAVEVGFESPAHFTREFKRRFGVSPSRSLAGLGAS